MEFGVFVPQGWRLDLMSVAGDRAKWETFTRVGSALDRAGWDSLWVYDHFHTFPRKEIEATFEAWTMMATLAQITERARIGQLVTCVQYREPSYLAKIAACVDVASNGRLNVGLGSGWYEAEFGAFGYDFRTTSKRLARLEETCEILTRMWRDELTTFEGKHYQVHDAVCEPKPLQRPRPPICIGGSGRKVLLRIVARHADVWNYLGSIEDFPETLEVLKGHCRDVGRDFDEIKVTVALGAICHETSDDLETFFGRIAAQGHDRDRVLKITRCKGSADRCAEILREWKTAGADGFVFYFHDIASVGKGDSQAEIFQRSVLPTV
ncbi:MAG: LLM class F420-dependent oxidoreductase [Myxococcales bacterium]|nr:MAG: LLM class F420-dependent oxidoreductase [Myxococcales bacterium]